MNDQMPNIQALALNENEPRMGFLINFVTAKTTKYSAIYWNQQERKSYMVDFGNKDIMTCNCYNIRRELFCVGLKAGLGSRFVLYYLHDDGTLELFENQEFGKMIYTKPVVIGSTVYIDRGNFVAIGEWGALEGDVIRRTRATQKTSGLVLMKDNEVCFLDVLKDAESTEKAIFVFNAIDNAERRSNEIARVKVDLPKEGLSDNYLGIPLLASGNLLITQSNDSELLIVNKETGENRSIGGFPTSRLRFLYDKDHVIMVASGEKESFLETMYGSCVYIVSISDGTVVKRDYRKLGTSVRVNPLATDGKNIYLFFSTDDRVGIVKDDGDHLEVEYVIYRHEIGEDNN